MNVIGHTNVVETVCFSNEKSNSMINVGLNSKTIEKIITPQYIISGGRDKSIKVWSISTGECVYLFVYFIIYRMIMVVGLEKLQFIQMDVIYIV